MTSLTVRILGPLQVAVDDTDFTPSAPKERALLAHLLLEPGRTVAADRLADDLWPKLSPDRSRRVLQVRIASLRRLLDDMPGDVVLRSGAGGYRIEAPGVELDAELFAKLASAGRVHARAGDAARAERVLRGALDLWRGDALMDVQLGAILEGVARRLDADRLAAAVDLLDVELQLGQHHERLPELEQLAKLHPFDERVWALHALALYRSGRQVEALRTCRTVRHRLVEDIGVVPGPALRQLESDLLAQRPELDWQAGETGSAATATMVERVAMPTVHYARSEDGTHLAYQVAGDGPLDLIIVPGLASHLETWWEAATGRLVRRLASFSRLILFDKRGTGLSDRPANINAHQWVDDVDVVLDAVGCERAAILAVSAGGPIGARYAARHPERVAALVLYGAFARVRWAEDYPIGADPKDSATITAATEATWGLLDQVDPVSGMDVGLGWYCPSVATNASARELWARYQRMAASPGAAKEFVSVATELDVRDDLAHISSPTLVLHATRDQCAPVALARDLAARIPGATLVEIDSADHLIWFSDAIDAVTAAIQTFLAPLAGRASHSR